MAWTVEEDGAGAEGDGARGALEGLDKEHNRRLAVDGGGARV